VATHVFRANDLFDPDFTGTGHQPMGFDQLMVFYNHFCVVNSRIRVIFHNTGSSNPTACIRIDADSTPITVIDRIVEFGCAVMETLEFKTGYGCNKELKLAVNIPRLQGVPRAAILADVNLRGTAAASPSEISYFHIQLWDASAVTSTCSFDVILEQEAVFTEPRDISVSMRSPAPAQGTDEKQTGWCKLH
jgi:hypothetical protein